MTVVVLLVLAAVAVAAIVWASSGWVGDDHPLAVEVRVSARGVDGTSALDERGGDKNLTAMTWNIGFGGGLTGNPSDVHTRDQVIANLDVIIKVITDTDPDVVFLQEVDRPSNRTGNIDQFAYIQDGTNYRYGCFATTWRLRYLPFPYWPPSKHIGQVHSGQAILSRAPIKDCRRITMPQPASYPWWYRPFYLHRSMQVATIEAPGQAPIQAINVHLEAFDEKNREEQAEMVGQKIRDIPASQRVILAGDFNALPASAKKKNDFIDEDIDFTNDKTLQVLVKDVSLSEVFDGFPTSWEDTMFTFPAVAPTRRLDYIFHRNMGKVVHTEAPRKARASDHLPVMATFSGDQPREQF